MTVMDATTDTGAHPTPSLSAVQPARRRGRRRVDFDGSLRREAQTIKAYRLGDDARRSVGTSAASSTSGTSRPTHG